jgi:hypothetical protein
MNLLILERIFFALSKSSLAGFFNTLRLDWEQQFLNRRGDLPCFLIENFQG